MSNLEGQTLGKYQMLERLGRGGMADVYKAYQPGLDRYVAVKVLHAHLSEDTDFIARFQREAKSVAKLRHPNIIQVIDFDSQNENYYMVMEFVEGGQSLKEYLQGLAARGERLPLAASVGLAAKLADALAYAHTEGMVHRDIKPANVLLPSLDKPLLGDFGIARIVGQTGLTAEGAMIGTPAYMSPEQGRGERADERSDIYALGIILYEMIANHPPYDADTPYGVILKHMNDPLVSPREFVAELPEAVERIVLKTLAKNPEDRYGTAADLRDALNKALGALKDVTQPSDSTAPIKGKASAAQTQVAPGQAGATRLAGGALGDEALTQQMAAGQPARKGLPGWVVAVGALAVIAVVGAVLFGTGALAGLLAGQAATPSAPGDGPSAGPVYETPAAATNTLADLPPDALEKWREGTRLLAEHNSGDAKIVFRSLLTKYPDNIDVMSGMALAHLEAGEERNATLITGTLEGANANTPLANAAIAMRYIWSSQGNPDAGFERLSAALDQCGTLDDNNIMVCIFALRERAWLNQWLKNDHDATFADINRAVEISPDEWTRQQSLDIRADLHGQFQEWAEGIADLEASNAAVNGEATWVLERGAYFAARLGDWDRGLALYDTMLAADPRNAWYLAGKGYLTYRKGDFGKARELAALALEFDPAVNTAHYLLALMAIDEGNHATATAELDAISNSADPQNYHYPFFRPELGYQIHVERARIALAQGDTDAALAYIEEGLAEDSWWPQIYMLRAQIYKDRGEVERARIDLNQAMEIATSQQREDLIAQIQQELDDLE